MKNVINNIDLQLMELEEIKELEIIANISTSNTDREIETFKQERELLQQYPEIYDRLKTLDLNQVKFHSLSLGH